MEWTPVLVAVITGICSVIAIVISNVASNKEMSAKLDKNQTVFEARITEQISQLRTQVEKHNNLIERVYGLEKNDAIQDAELHRLGKRITVVEESKAG